MAIRFQETEAKAPNALPKPDYYYGKIIEASMRQPRDMTRPPYLNVTYELLDEFKNKCGRLYDIIAESDKPFMQYKLQRFGGALGLTGKEFELADLAKIIIGKVIIFKTKIEQSAGYADKAVVDIGDEGIYYHKSEAANFFNPAAAAPAAPAPKKIEVDESTDNDSAPFDVDGDDEF